MANKSSDMKTDLALRVRDSSGKPAGLSPSRGLVADSPTRLLPSKARWSEGMSRGTPKKHILWSTLTITLFCSFGPPLTQQESPIQVVERVFKEYIAQAEDTESQANKGVMQQALKTLLTSARPSDLPLLINVWMYYDPTDFPTRDLIDPIFENNRDSTLAVIRERLVRKEKWESEDTAPFSDLIALNESLKKGASR